MLITQFSFRTSMGQIVTSDEKQFLSFISEEELSNFNSIGYTGKDNNGRKIGRIEYLNSLRPNEMQFSLYQTKYDNGDFCEAFVMAVVIISQTK